MPKKNLIKIAKTNNTTANKNITPLRKLMLAGSSEAPPKQTLQA
jgi:hypothetical protein